MGIFKLPRRSEFNFQRGKKFVIDRHGFIQPFCENRWEEAFQDMINRDAARTAAFAS
jgi:hypothetical protein